MLLWHGRVHLIDHGAALIFHHSWTDLEASASRPYDARDARAGRQPGRTSTRPTPSWRRW